MAFSISALNIALTSFVIWRTFKILDYLQTKISTKLLLFIVLPILAFADFMASWLSSIIWLGPQGQIDTVLPMGSLALPLVQTPLRYASRIVGFYGLASFLWAFVYLSLNKKIRRYAYLPVVFLCILSFVGWVSYRAKNGSTIKVKIINESLQAQLPSIDASGIDLVVFPEYGLDKTDNTNLNKRIIRTNNTQQKTYFIGSAQLFDSSYVGHINNMLMGNTVDGFVDNQYKYRLIPGGEDLSYVLNTFLRIIGQKGTINYFNYAHGVISGQSQLHPFVIDASLRVGAAVCSSIIAPQDYRLLASKGATLFTNSASLGIFKGSPVFSWQQKNLARFMAVANNRFFLQAANDATIYALDNNGNSIAELKIMGYKDVIVQTNDLKTLYTYIGEWMAWLGGLILLAGLFYKKFKTLVLSSWLSYTKRCNSLRRKICH
ncbi:hypothetical protein KDA11_03365 [Candidatus Saccharibacteria bacterium]|nr:hypothetical protein [Candidatus Saccharibacteria bacterium]